MSTLTIAIYSYY